MPQLIITAVGPDRPGLVGDFTGLLFRDGLNIAESRMVNLRGQFALLVLAEGTADALGRVKKELPDASARLSLAVHFAEHGPGGTAVAGLPYRLRTYSLDQPGIVHRVSAVLQRHGVNIEDLQATLASGAFGGGPVFTLDLRLTVPGKVPVRTLRQELETLCAELNCDLDLEPA